MFKSTALRVLEFTDRWGKCLVIVENKPHHVFSDGGFFYVAPSEENNSVFELYKLRDGFYTPAASNPIVVTSHGAAHTKFDSLDKARIALGEIAAALNKTLGL